MLSLHEFLETLYNLWYTEHIGCILVSMRGFHENKDSSSGRWSI